MSALDDLANERKRQIEVEHWSAEHDDTHAHGELGLAASLYANPDNVLLPRPAYALNDPNSPPTGWPWRTTDWKPRDYRRNLVRAGALIIAEIERIDRACVSPPSRS